MMKQIAEYLELLKLSYKWHKAEDMFHLAFSEDQGKVEYTIRINITDKWVQVFTDIYEVDKIPVEKRAAVFQDLLAANRKYAEVCFDYNETKRRIGTSQEQMKQGLTFDTFRAEFLAVPWAVKKFWSEIATKYDLK
ncbi:MAG: hypothetical protein JSW61_03725 [Candidatus Thorarchaeota archaeon]|nr:MAG: hypothetical protein JSW61_03725 [Candidatus Thorarchaeota archaeon]